MYRKKYKSNQKYRSNKYFYIGALFIILVLSGISYYAVRSYTSGIDKPDNVNFGVWFPAKKSDYILDKSTLQYDSRTAIITFKLKNKKDKGELTFTEQSVPEGFAVAPDAFDKQVAGLQQSTKFDSIHGTVALTKPFGGSSVTAIMRSQGTLLYVNSQQELSTDQWRSIFNSLELVR